MREKQRTARSTNCPYVNKRRLTSRIGFIEEKYAPSLLSTICHVLIWGILFSTCFALAASFIMIALPGDLAWYLYQILRWPSGAFIGMLLGVMMAFLRRTAIEIAEDQILIHTCFRQKCFTISQFADSSIIRRTHILSYGKFTTAKCYLLFNQKADSRGAAAFDISGELEKCRLYGFREKELEAVLAAVRKRQAALLSEAEKARIQDQYRNDTWNTLAYESEADNTFSLPVSVLIAKEKKWLQKITLILVCIALIIGALDLLEIQVSRALDIQLLFLTLLALAIPVILSAAWIRLYLRGKICAGSVTVGDDHLMIGSKYYSYSGLCQIRMTSLRKRSSSAFPVQYYMYLTTSGGREKYRLGSEASFGDYPVLCGRLEEALVFCPGKLEYI